MKLLAYMVFLKGKLSKSILTFSTGIFCLKGRLTYKMEIGTGLNHNGFFTILIEENLLRKSKTKHCKPGRSLRRNAKTPASRKAAKKTALNISLLD